MRAALYLLATLGMLGCGVSGRGGTGGTQVGSGTPGDPGEPGDDPGDDGHGLLVPLDGQQSQGTFLLGQKLDALGMEPGYYANALTTAVTADGQAVTVELGGAAALRVGDHRGADPYFNGMIFTGSEGATMRLTASRGGFDLALYRLELKTPAGWINLCDQDGDEVVPLAGRWQKSGFHEAVPGRLSFACTSAVGFKCTLWGYLAGSDDTALGWRAHQACTRMARGDYCASGHPHTRQGTQIRIYDLVGVASPPPTRFQGVQDWPPNVGRMFFEAAWSDAAHPATCLSRLRWQSLPTGTLCDDGELRDPRLDTGVRFCEDLTWPAPGSDPTGALLFNESHYTDLSLHVWQHGDDLVSTVRGYYEMPDVIQPFPAVGGYTHVRNDGIILRELRSDLDPADFEELHLDARPGDFVVAGVSQPPPGFSDVGFEGYANPRAIAGTVAFILYRHDVTGDYVSTTAVLPAPYTAQWTIGYVLPPEQR
ncbi:MAG TPA: ADYC domain-containing protein [Kofleriaceae bacterium]|nr:ADYC domain-containing protein [Kofleriaceae bacterium]